MHFINKQDLKEVFATSIKFKARKRETKTLNQYRGNEYKKKKKEKTKKIINKKAYLVIKLIAYILVVT